MLQPRGTQALVQVLGSGGISTMLAQVWAPPPLQVCGTALHAIGVGAPQVCGTRPLHAAAVPATQASLVTPLHAAAAAPPHVGGFAHAAATPPLHTPLEKPLHTPLLKPPQVPLAVALHWPAMNPVHWPFAAKPVHFPFATQPVHAPPAAQPAHCPPATQHHVRGLEIAMQDPAAMPAPQAPATAPPQVGWTALGVQVCGVTVLVQVWGTVGPVWGQSGLVMSHHRTLSFS